MQSNCHIYGYSGRNSYHDKSYSNHNNFLDQYYGGYDQSEFNYAPQQQQYQAWHEDYREEGNYVPQFENQPEYNLNVEEQRREEELHQRLQIMEEEQKERQDEMEALINEATNLIQLVAQLNDAI